MAERDPRVLRDYIIPQATNIASSIVNLAIEANNFELRPALVSFVEKDQFGGCPMENPHIYLRNFLAKCDTINLNGVSDHAVRLRLLSFSLMNRASDWLLNEEPNSFTTWEALSRAFFAKYFPLSKTTKLRAEIASFSQRGDESPYEVWERFQDLQRRLPRHGVFDWFLIQTFYDGLDQSLKMFVGAAANGAPIEKLIEAKGALLAEMASNNYH